MKVIANFKYKIISFLAKHQYALFRLLSLTGSPCTMRKFQGVFVYFCPLQTVQQFPVRSIPRSLFISGKFLTIPFFKICLHLFILGQCFRIFPHNGMNHCHFKGGDFFCSGLCFSYFRREVIVDIQFVKYLFVNTVDSTDTLDNTGWIIGDVIIEYSSSPMQVIPFRNSVCRNQYVEIVPLQRRLQTGIKVRPDLLFIGRCCIRRCIFHHRESGFYKCLTQIVYGICIF